MRATTLLDSFSECNTQTLHGAVDRGIGVWSGDTCADRAGGLQSNGHRTGHGIALTRAISLTKQNPGTTERPSATHQGCKHPVLRVSARLSADRFIPNNGNAVHPRTQSQGPGHLPPQVLASQLHVDSLGTIALPLQTATSGLQHEMPCPRETLGDLPEPKHRACDSGASSPVRNAQIDGSERLLKKRRVNDDHLQPER